MSYIARTIILYITVVVVMRIMGKRQVGQLQPYELAVAIMISELAAVPMQDINVPLFYGIIPILTLLLAQMVSSYLTLKSIKMRRLICSHPVILIDKGKIIENNLRNENYNLNELIEQLRIKDVSNISDVEYAILETNGQVSVILKSDKRAATTGDLDLKAEYEGLPFDLIIDGYLLKENIKKAGLDVEWLKKYFKKYGINTFKDIFFANVDDKGRIFYQLKEGAMVK